MKNIIVSLALAMIPPASVSAAWVGRFDLNPAVSPIVIRELHDGQWIAGITKENLWHLDNTGAGALAGQRAHVGIFEAWNAQHGNASFGTVVGIDIPVKLAEAIQSIGESFGLQQSFKPLSYVGSALSLDAIAGLRPAHSADVSGPFVYGFGARLNVAFGVSELKKGL